MKEFLQLVALSFILHIVMFFSIVGLSVFIPRNLPTKPNIVEVEILPREQRPDRTPLEQQIVRQADAPETKIESPEDEARFLSEKSQRVRKEMQAATSGLTKNRPPAQQKSQEPLSLAELTKTRKGSPQMQREDFPREDNAPKISAEKEMEQFAQQTEQLQAQRAQQQLPSTSSDALPQDVSIGSMTALNTDRLTYYSFYSRVNEAIYFRWNSRVKNSLDSFDRNYLRNVVRLNRWVTQAEILLRPDGKVHKVLIMKESGILQFDLAAANAFKEAARFPNPPKEMVQDDGFIHLKYSFTVAIN